MLFRTQNRKMVEKIWKGFAILIIISMVIFTGITLFY